MIVASSGRGDRQVSIAGYGIAAAACHVLLRQFGWATVPAAPAGTPVPPIPFLVIDPIAVRLIGEVFGKVPEGGMGTNRRIVVHHASEQISVFGENRYVISAAASRRLYDFSDTHSVKSDDGCLMHTTGAASGQWISSGERRAWICEAHAVSPETQRSLLFEFVPGGWVFWAPTAERRGFVQFGVPQAFSSAQGCQNIWDSTRTARRLVALHEAWPVQDLRSAACLRRQTRDRNVVYCGSSALRSDPIAGEGLSTSLRSAILACAALRFANEFPSDEQRVWAHYHARLASAFRDHLVAAGDFYLKAKLSRSWDEEIGAMSAARTELTKVPAKVSLPQFRLENLSLAAV